ncbi:hypothetical protein H2248_003145 [Termitomyces sp. 'cryptogamus']|nr:hypothetical protein H2248_003145 [Termitomyces sp. 'cryptogamus']
MKLIVIVGITGTQGGSVANVFLSEPGWRIRGVTRNLSQEASKNLEAKGIEMVVGDLDNPSTLIPAFEGAHAIFGVTDFWQPILHPENTVPLPSDQPLNQACYDLEVRRGKNIANAAAKVSTLERFVFSSVPGAKKWSKGKFSRVYNFDSKAAVVDYIQESLPDLAKKMSTVYIGLYAANWKIFPFLGPRKQSDGTYVLSLATDPNTPLPMIDTGKDTGYLVRALIQVPAGKTLLGFGSMISWSDYMKLWGDILGLPGSRYEQIGLETAAKLVPEDRDLGYEIAEGFAFMGEFGFDGGDPTVLHAQDLGVDCPTTSMETYIRNEDWSSILC